MRRRKKNLVERAYIEGPRLGLETWCEDEAGPFQTVPHPTSHWAREQKPRQYPHEYVREGTAKLLTLFHPADGRVIVRGVSSCTNKVLHPWVEKQMNGVVEALPQIKTQLGEEENHRQWESWQSGLTVRFTLPEKLPRLRVLLVLDNLTGHKTPEFVLWLVGHGIMPLYTPLGGCWLNMAESIQRILKNRGLGGQYPRSTDDIIAWLEETARGWNRHPTPFVWAGKRATRRARARQRLHALGGSGACTITPILRMSRRPPFRSGAKRLTH